MSLSIHVCAYSGHKANERPTSFCLDEDLIDIDEVEDRWYDPEAAYFRVRSTEGKRYILGCSTDGERTLQSGFDGEELLARPRRRSRSSIRFNPRGLRQAWRFRVRHGRAGALSNCHAELEEKALVEPHGGIEIAKDLCRK